MSSKLRRLEALKALGGKVPETVFSLAEFTARTRDPSALWWVRATSEQPSVRYALAQGPWTTEQVSDPGGRVSRDQAGGGCVIQQYLPPKLSGVTYVARDWVLTAAIAGACAPLLREGASGALFGRMGEHRWQIKDSELPGRAQGSIETVQDQICTMGKGVLVEWIATSDDSLYHVDYKEIGIDLLAVPPFPEPGCFVVGIDGNRPEELVASTSIGNLEVSGSPQTLRCRSGSPLAHLCVEVASRGGRVVVERPTRPAA